MTQNTSVLELIGNTPLFRLTWFETGCCQLYLKLECNNPYGYGSIKVRTSLSIINTAEHQEELKPRQAIFEATAGNTSISLAAICRSIVYPMNTIIPDKKSQEKIELLKLMGANVILTYVSILTDIRRQTGIYGNLIRLLVGIKAIDDLRNDLDHALSD